MLSSKFQGKNSFNIGLGLNTDCTAVEAHDLTRQTEPDPRAFPPGSEERDEDLVDYIEQIKRGEISKTDIALELGKQAVAASGFDILSTAKKFLFSKKHDSKRSK